MVQRCTIKEVAAEAGVSIASASRALNGHGASEATQAKVLAAARKLGYKPDASARSLKLGKTFQLAYAVADIGNPVYVEMMSAIENVVAAAGYRLIVTATGDVEATIDLVDSLHRGYADGMIISPLRVSDELMEKIRNAPVPIVVLGRTSPTWGIDTIQADSERGISLAVDHLLDTGRRRIAFVNGPLDTTPGMRRREAFDRTMAARGVTPVGYASGTDFTVAPGREAALELLADSNADIDGLVAANDLLAIGTLQAAQEQGLRVPQDVGITGMDDIELMTAFTPQLTSVNLGAAERGAAAAKLLLNRLKDPSRAPVNQTVPARLMVRKSTHNKGGGVA